MSKKIMNSIIKPISYVWKRLLLENRIPMDRVIVEIAPGYETKIGDALAMLGFRGTVILVEPDAKAAEFIGKAYKSILPLANVQVVVKPMQEIDVGTDVPEGVAAIVANHPFDDMVLGSVVDPDFFSQERIDGTELSQKLREIYDTVSDNDYVRGILITVTVWKDLIQRIRPACFIASQYPSHRLSEKKLVKRQNSGYMAMEFLREFYERCLSANYDDKSFGYQDEPRWWIITRRPYSTIVQDLEETPQAKARLTPDIFVPQKIRQLLPEEYDVVYVNEDFFAEYGYREDVWAAARNFAIATDNENVANTGALTAWADRQGDTTQISLSGNLGSGRAVYRGDRYNILGLGKTTLCKSPKASHATGNADLLGALHRVVLSRWINHFTHRAPHHPVVIAKKQTGQFKFSTNPLPLAIVVRVDDGDLDRPSHVELDPNIDIDFDRVITEYAQLDAEYFAYRFMLGAWSMGNYSLYGRVIDLESASFVRFRGPYTTASNRHKENFYGYEGMGFILILRQLAKAKCIETENLEEVFYHKRREHLGRCFLTLLGIEEAVSDKIFSSLKEDVLALADQFEMLAKKISPKKRSLNLFHPVPEEEDPALLDMSELFRNLWALHTGREDRIDKALEVLIRKQAIKEVQPDIFFNIDLTKDKVPNQGEIFLAKNAVITSENLPEFLIQTRVFVNRLFELLDQLKNNGQLPKGGYWKDRLITANQDFPNMDILNTKLLYWIEEYRTGKIGPGTLGAEIEKLCQLPNYPTGKSFQWRDIPLLNHMILNDEEMDSVSALFETLSYIPGQEIMGRNDEADSLHVLVQGTLAVLAENGVTVAKITNRGTLIGEAAALGQTSKRSATVVAETSAILLRVSRYDLERLVSLHPELRGLFENTLRHKLLGIDKKVLSLKAFRGIDPEDMRLFLARHAMTYNFKAGQRVINQGDRPKGVYLLMKGSVDLLQTSENNGEVKLNDLPLDHGLFGEWGIISNAGASCNVIAVSDGMGLYLSEDLFLALLKRYPRCLDNCLNRIRSYSEANMARQDLASRFRNGLSSMELSEQTLTLIDECY